jgi:AbrB family looped-hinge helix DNA binding protein
MATAVKITEKGQITIPREIREVLKTKLISFSVLEGVVTLRPIHDVGGSLQAYAKNAASTASFRDIKEAAWEEAVREKIKR